MTISNEAVDIAIKIWSREIGEQSYEDSMRMALEAAAPIIRAEALEQAADAFENLPMNKGASIRSGTWDWFDLFPIEHIRARAAAERGKP